MHDRRRRLAAGLTVLALLLIAVAAALPRFMAKNEAPREGNLLVNGDFSAVTGGVPDGWSAGMWVTSAGASYLEGVTLEDGTTAALIENAARNDARFEQTVTVRENAVYCLSARVRAEGVDADRTGANLSFLGIYGTSECVYDTDGEWVNVSLYASTGKGQREATVCVRLGGYGSEAAGKAWFTDVSLCEVEDAPVGAYVLDIAPREAAQAAEPAEEGGEFPAIPALLAGAAAYLALAALLLNLLRAGGRDGARANWRPALAALLLAAFAVRAALAFLVEGYGVDMSCFTAWAMRMADVGPVGFYEEGYFCDYPPAYMLVLGLFGLLSRWTGLPLTGALGQALFKLVPVACDLALAGLTFAVCAREAGRRPAFALAALVAFSPALLVTGSCWGQIDALLALLLVLVLLAAREGRWRLALPLFALTVLTKPQAGLLAPLGIVALARDIKRGDGASRRRILSGLGLGVALALLVVLPFSPRQQSPLWLVDNYVRGMTGYQYATLSTGNLMFLLGGNWVKTAEAALGPITYGQLGGLLMALSFLAGVVVYLRGEGRSRLWLASALTMQGVFCLGAMMHERYIIPALLLLLFAFIETGDARLLASFALSGAASAVNIGVVLAYDYLIPPHMAVGYAISAMQLASFALTAWACVSLSLGRAPLRLPARRADDAKAAPGSAPDAREAACRDALLRAPDAALHMTRRDWAVMLAITAAYAVVGLTNLGETRAPQGGYTSTAPGESVVFDLGERREDFHVYYYGGVSYSAFSVAASDDGVAYGEPVDAFFEQGDCYKWLALRQPIYGANGDVTGVTGGMLSFSGRYVRLTFADAGVALWEVGFVDGDGNALPVAGAEVSGGLRGRMGDPLALVDEQDTVPVKPTYMNSMYFDEVYHARTGYEHAHGQYVYETTHPPLGKVFMGMSISALGMTPFAWRLPGALAGVLMLPALYLLAKQLFGRTRWAALSTALFALDCMHYTQTRIATIDSFPVLFIILMFLCMLRWTRMSFFHQPLWRTLAPLALSGAFMGMAIASKWIGCYGAVGLALLFFARLGGLWRQSVYASRHRREDARFAAAADGFMRKAVVTCLWCCVFFVAVPLVIYCLSYIPYLRAYGHLRPMAALERIWQAQVTMFEYHKNLVAEHGYASPWYEWPIIAKPMWFYRGEYSAPGKVSTIMTFGNPAVWWTGLAAILYALMESLRRNALPALGLLPYREDARDRALPLICVGFLSAYLPWVLVSRLTFIYHYFASVPFIILATAQALSALEAKREKLAHALALILVLAALALFVAFFPLASGVEVPRAWADAMNWFPGWMAY